MKNFVAKYKETLFLLFVALVVIVFYCINFNNGISKDNGDWGTFGDYFGGILNPITSAFAFYLVAKTYNLQKKSHFEQIQLAALTATLNSKRTRVSLLRSEKEFILNTLTDSQRKAISYSYSEDVINPLSLEDSIYEDFSKLRNISNGTEEDKNKDYFCYSYKKLLSINKEIQELEESIKKLESMIEEYI